MTTTLDELGVSYVVGGSVASSVHGIPRSTADSDLVAALREEHVDRFVSSPQPAFYVDPDMIRDAIRTRFEFNVPHLATMFKVDVFVPPLDTVIRRELSRGSRIDVGDGRTFVVASPEDTIAQKLRWFAARHTNRTDSSPTKASTVRFITRMKRSGACRKSKQDWSSKEA